eukprot:CAMPEP_0178421484 /NCGR_PEP_ID=MMETSP0689_2-20121128/26671_1 /TAXON_ID=160604 /ORGANISM="Amphidinium massartii, Strain CS-259" /LENGTH=384 /DNA_ID=CAMNT_0020042997 /DNA_START=53 /DNA_END=1207 /DNA_ORIENTATION=+
MPRDDASQVEVQTPPGLGGVAGSLFAERSAPLEGSDLGIAAAQGSEAIDVDENFKQELVREVSRVVSEHLECKTSEAVDALWRKGQRALCSMQQKQLDQTALLQRQLEECTAAHQRLEQESAMLRNQFEALLGSLKVIMGVSPVPPATPLFSPSQQARQPPQTPSSRSEGAEALQSAQDSSFSSPSLGSPWQESTSSRDTATSPLLTGDTGSDTGASTIAPPSVVQESSSNKIRPPTTKPAEAAPQSCQTEARTFSLTLRRAHGVPLGLDVSGQAGSSLTVLAIRPGGAVEAWNKQCAGDAREVRAGDRIIMVNDFEDATDMRSECRQKLLLRIKILRAAESTASENMTNPDINGAARGLRADASVFVPQVGGSSAEAGTGALV